MWTLFMCFLKVTPQMAADAEKSRPDRRHHPTALHSSSAYGAMEYSMSVEYSMSSE